MHGNMRTFLLMAAMTALLMGMGWLIGGQGGAALALVVAGVGNLWAWWNSDKAVLRQHGAMPVTEAEAPDLVRMVRQLADRAGLPMPRVYVLATEQPNAFATGRNPENSAVAVTQGLLRILTRDELAGVIAHELAHIRHRDRPGGALGGILAMILAPLAAMLVQMAISRSREYVADRSGAEICGNPMALASALAKIANAAGRTVNIPAERNPASASMFIINPLGALRMDQLFSTHPSTQERIDLLARMQAAPAAPSFARSSVPPVRRG